MTVLSTMRMEMIVMMRMRIIGYNYRCNVQNMFMPLLVVNLQTTTM